ncbi:hypothetical protein [Microlunatus sp. GCM10028923]|uniref:hypothetical protein n=1 Tax=Microlunatus sp. GCM10028923 TaxID=3273400 RepID=UPI003620FD20
MTSQYSPLSSPLSVESPRTIRSTLVPSSFSGRQTPPLKTSLPDCSPNDSVALSVSQHWSPVLRWPLFPPRSSAQLLYDRSMEPGHIDQPSPSQVGWLLVATVRPSTEFDEYDNSSSGLSSPGTGGVRIGYVHSKPPLCVATCQVPDGASEVAL